MNLKVFVFVAACGVAPLHADTTPNTAAGTTTPVSTTVLSTTTVGTSIAAARALPGGRYYGTIAPSFNASMGKQLEKALATIPGVDKVVSHVDDSTVHFDVADNSKVQDADVLKMVAKADAGAVMSTPILEHSLAVSPGL